MTEPTREQVLEWVRQAEDRAMRKAKSETGASVGRWMELVEVELCALAFAAGAKAATCVWTLADEDADMWETSCKHAFVIVDGTPAQNDMHFCCYCGGQFEEARRPA